MTAEIVQKPVLDVSIRIIKVGERARKDLGDISTLAASIEQLGLLQPIGIDPNYRLVFGERRLRAFEALGRDTIPARIVHVSSLIAAEHAENEIRKDFTPTERNAIARAMEEYEREEAKKRQGARTDLGADIRQNFARSREKIAEAAGFGNHETMRQSMLVEAHAEPELVEAMDRGKVAISTAATLAKAEPEVQRDAAANPKKAAELARKASAAKVREIKDAASDDVRRKREEKEALFDDKAA